MPRIRWPFKNFQWPGHWARPPAGRLLPILAAGVVLISLAVAATLWMLDQRVDSIKKQVSHTQIKTAQPTQELRPLPDAWESVINEIYSNRDDPALTRAPDDNRPQYEKNARALPIVPPETPKIAIVIDDVGVNRTLSEEAEAKLPAEVTFSYLPYGQNTMTLAKIAREKGREVMVHLPMEPMPRPEEPPINPGDDALYVELSSAEIKLRVRKNLRDPRKMAVGCNNHIGSKFTS